MKKYLMLFFTCQVLGFFSGIAQNLVPDPGFEIVRRLPTKKSNPVTCTKNWLSPTLTASDYYHTDAGRHAGAPRNIFGKQKPHSGKAYAGICIRKNFMEYLETKLSDSLEKGREYLVEFYICKAELSLSSVTEFGILFTKKQQMGMSEKGIAIKPSVDFPNPRKYRNKRSWTKLSAVYTAEGGEAALILGYFNYDKPKYKGNCHYYIDDVTVTPVKKDEELIVVANTEEFVPKEFSPKLGETITLQNIFFAKNKSELLTPSFPELDKLAKFLKEDSATTIEISGHTDNTGNESQNKILSTACAKAVADYLVSKGIDSERIEYIGYGSIMPVAANDTEVGRQQNRRVEFIINKK
ncbi:MAG TPA: OmpA family protein [Bacteroidia bacterium]